MSTYFLKNGRMAEMTQRGMKTMVALPEWVKAWEASAGKADTVEAYKSSAWAFRAVNLRADSIASAPLKLYDKNDEEIESHPILDLLDMVNPEWNRGDLWRYTECGNLVFGAAYWLKARVGGRVTELYYLNPGNMEVVISSEGIVGFKQSDPAKEYARQDVVYFRGAYDPNSELQGLASLTLAAVASLGEANADSFLNDFFLNGAIPPLLLTSEQPRPAESVVEKLAEWWRRTFQGKGKQHRTAMLWSGMKPVQLSYPIEDLALPEVRQEMHRTISTALGVPELLISPTNAADLTPVEMAEHVFYSTTIVPRWHWYEEILNIELLGEYADLVNSGAYLKFDTSDVTSLQEDQDNLAKRLALLVQARIITPECAALELGYNLEDVPEKQEVPEVLKPFVEGEQPPKEEEPRLPADRQGREQEPPENPAVREEAKRWERKAINALKRGKSANVEFASDIIPLEVHERVMVELAKCKTAEDVRAVFANCEHAAHTPDEVTALLEGIKLGVEGLQAHAKVST